MILDLAYNFHWIDEGEVARAAQAYAGFLPAFLRAHGIQAVINLRGSNPGHLWWRYETRVCRKLGVIHRDAKLNSRQLPSQRMLLDLVDGFDAVPRPFLVKCSGGQDRTAFAAALYVLHRRGWCALAQAERQFSLWPYLHLPRRHQRWLKLFPAFANETSAGKPLRAWLEQSYSASDFAAWLRARGQSRSFEGLYGVPAGTKA